MQHRKLFASVLILICSANVAVKSFANGVGEDTTSSIDLAEIHKRATQLMNQPQMAGLSLAIVENGEMTYSKGYGTIQRGSDKPVTADTVFRWASVSKGVAAAAILSLQEDGHFIIEEPASDFAESLELPANKVDVSIEDILSHRIGIVRNAYDRRIEDGRPAKDVRRALKNLRYHCDPGTCHTYQNVAFDASSEIVETITGLPLSLIHI